MRTLLYAVPFLLLVIVGCKKEYETAPRPYNEITSFTVAEGTQQDAIEAVLDVDTVMVIWPAETSWPMPDSIAPVITVSEGATIVPASGAKVKFTDGVSYTVKAEDGTTRQYQLKVMVGGAKPVITDETPVTKRVGSNVSVSLENMRGDINENKLILVGENGSEYTLINRIIGAGFCSFIADTENGAGIPAGDYYLKAINRFDIPVTSKTKFIAISNDAPTPYAYFTHTDTIRVKAGETFSLPVRHAAATNTFSRVRCYYYEYGYITAMNFEVVGLTDNNTMLTLRVPEDALPMVAVSKEGIIMTSNNGTSYSQAMPFPIQVIP